MARKVRLPDGLIPVLCEIVGLALACAAVFVLFGLGWALLAMGLALVFVGFAIGE